MCLTEEKTLGDVDTVLTEIQDFMRGRLGQHVILGGDFNVSFAWIDRLSSCGRVDPKTENADGHKRYPARASIARCCVRSGPDGDEHLDGRRLRTGFVHTMQLDESWRRADANGLYHDLEETGSKTGTSAGSQMTLRTERPQRR